MACVGTSCATLRDAVVEADGDSTDDTITFMSGLTGEITLNQGPITVDDLDYLTISGPGAGVISVSGDTNTDNMPNAGDSQVLTVYDDGPLTVSGLTLKEGYGDYAGAVHTDPNTEVTLAGVAVTGSLATGDYCACGPFGDADFSGGGITNRGEMTIANSSVTGNTSDAPTTDPYGGGGIQNAGRMTISGSTISGNTATGFGGGIWQAFGKYFTPTLDISNSVISGNSAALGGGVANYFSISFIGGGRNKISNSTISGNHADAVGGGMALKYLAGDERWVVSHTTISGNDAVDYGGGIALGVVGGSFELVDSTVSGNVANVGAGVDLSGAAQKYQDSLEFDNSTIASNGAASTGGGIYLGDQYGPPQPTPLNSTIVADNSPQDLDLENGGNAASFDLSFSLVEAPGDAPITQSPAGSSLFGMDPQLGPLTSNGGPTLTHLPAITSPVVDKGTAAPRLTTDQRGAPRTVDTSVPNASDGTDIGSVERSTGPPPAVTVISLEKKKKGNKKGPIRTKKDKVKVEMIFTSNLAGATFQCKVDKGPFKPCTSPFTTKVKSEPGKGKKHTITVQAVDPQGGALGPPVAVEFRVVKVE